MGYYVAGNQDYRKIRYIHFMWWSSIFVNIIQWEKLNCNAEVIQNISMKGNFYELKADFCVTGPGVLSSHQNNPLVLRLMCYKQGFMREGLFWSRPLTDQWIKSGFSIQIVFKDVLVVITMSMDNVCFQSQHFLESMLWAIS